LKKSTDHQQSGAATFLGFVMVLLVVHKITGLPYLLESAIALGMGALLLPNLANRLSTNWLSIAARIGNIQGAILLSLIFWLVLSPIAMVYRI